MIERRDSIDGPSQERSLITFRVFVRVDDPGVATFAATRLEDHRNVYLDYEGPVSGNRGEVVRVATGHVASVEEGNRAIVIGLDVGVFIGRAKGGEEWLFHRQMQSA